LSRCLRDKKRKETADIPNATKRNNTERADAGGVCSGDIYYYSSDAGDYEDVEYY
jgi:hypothetical protein